MKIIKYVKKKNNLYEVTLSNKEKINLFDDVILKYELLLKSEFDEKLLKEIIEFNNQIEAYNISLKFIISKLRTEKEVRKKLNNYNKKIQDYVINRLTSEGYLNNELYIKAYVNDSVNLKFIGPNKIKYELKKLSFNELDIDNYLNTIESIVWEEKINKYIKKKIETNTKLSGTLLKNKIISDLLNKGFYKEDIYTNIDNFTYIDNKNIYEKEYEKLKNKLGKKYSGEYLDYYIKLNLRKKGFNLDD